MQSGVYFRKGELLRRMLGKKNKAEGARPIHLAADLAPCSYA